MIDKKYNIILGSKSPRRSEILNKLQIKFKISIPDCDEKYPQTLKGCKISEFIAIKKSESLLSEIKKNDLLITCDTIIVTKENDILNKPIDKNDAYNMLNKLNNNEHYVISSVCLRSNNKLKVFSEETKVTFNRIPQEIIQKYVNSNQPLDKAGGYGIQDWFGLIGVKKISGNYTNVMGLPAGSLYFNIREF
ncbi:MAG: septum formation protein Maf [Flavobacteriales bacterium]|nr:septum formation protein Maf [Flavobacteriales bacterium]|tara:strand:- start:278 stop:853 length:576 start_codon:yes stop_codon:yes gene_type:complete